MAAVKPLAAVKPAGAPPAHPPAVSGGAATAVTVGVSTRAGPASTPAPPPSAAAAGAGGHRAAPTSQTNASAAAGPPAPPPSGSHRPPPPPPPHPGTARGGGSMTARGQAPLRVIPEDHEVAGAGGDAVELAARDGEGSRDAPSAGARGAGSGAAAESAAKYAASAPTPPGGTVNPAAAPLSPPPLLTAAPGAATPASSLAASPPASARSIMPIVGSQQTGGEPGLHGAPAPSLPATTSGYAIGLTPTLKDLPASGGPVGQSSSETKDGAATHRSTRSTRVAPAPLVTNNLAPVFAEGGGPTLMGGSAGGVGDATLPHLVTLASPTAGAVWKPYVWQVRHRVATRGLGGGGGSRGRLAARAQQLQRLHSCPPAPLPRHGVRCLGWRATTCSSTRATRAVFSPPCASG
jgi:hypothetical protein